MPERVTFHNSIFDRKCSKCKHTKEALFFTSGSSIYKTCNACRFNARRNSRRNPWTALAVSTAAGYEYEHVAAAASSSSSTSAAADYFVEEPDPEPEPKT
jgi:hypothetical protein